MRETVVTIAASQAHGDKLKNVQSSFPGEADAVAYIYDGLGKMRYREVEENSVTVDKTWYRYDLGWNVLGEYADHGGSFWWVDVKERGYLWEGMTALAAIEGANPATGAAAYYTHDHLGSTRGVYGAAGEVLASVGYGPYGAPSTHNAGATPAFSYTGKPYDDATGLYHFPYRQYDPNAARWLTRDPLGMVDGPNVYAYVMGNPVGAVDPLGLSAVALPTPAGDSDCTAASPASSNSGICNVYNSSDTYSGFGAKCVCENAGDSRWDRMVRGCLACYHKAGLDAHEAHKTCYKAATRKYGYAAAAIAIARVVSQAQKCCEAPSFTLPPWH